MQPTSVLDHQGAIEWSINPVHPKFERLRCGLCAAAGIRPIEVCCKEHTLWLIAEDHLQASDCEALHSVWMHRVSASGVAATPSESRLPS